MGVCEKCIARMSKIWQMQCEVGMVQTKILFFGSHRKIYECEKVYCRFGNSEKAYDKVNRLELWSVL